jgi:hypothetical protein
MITVTYEYARARHDDLLAEAARYRRSTAARRTTRRTLRRSLGRPFRRTRPVRDLRPSRVCCP